MKALILALLFICALTPSRLATAEAATERAEPTVEQRLADIEAYINNNARATDGKAASKISGPGPAHNGWMMVSSALVLFMTLPGLALFYGGLVRSKNVLSVIAQCFGLAGMVSILWWAVGYSLSFGDAGSVCGGVAHAFMQGVDVAPNTNYGHWVSHNIYFMRSAMAPTMSAGVMIANINW